MIQIPLKEKYRRGFKGRNKGGEKPAPKKHRNKVGREAHVKRYGEPPVYRLVVEGRRGKGVFVRDA